MKNEIKKNSNAENELEDFIFLICPILLFTALGQNSDQQSLE